jgi:hypothetical protein
MAGKDDCSKLERGIMLYPYNAPIIMTDTIYETYGGIIGDESQEMRNVAYQISEQFVSEDIDTFLLPTIVTGTYSYSPRIILDHAFVTKVHLLRFYDQEEKLYWTVTGTANIFASLRDNGEYGLVDLNNTLGHCGGCQSFGYPEKISVIYQAGLSSGTSYQPNVLLALTMMSKILVNEMVGFGNEAPGDIGVQSYSNQNYRETRVGLLRTVYGTSAQAQFIKKLIDPLKVKRFVGLL